MSFFPVPVIHPQLNSRHVLELWQYQWNEGRQDFDRVSYQPIQFVEPDNNPVPNVTGLNRYPAHPIRLDDLSAATIEMLAPGRVARPEQPSRPMAPVFGNSSGGSSGAQSCPCYGKSSQSQPFSAHLFCEYTDEEGYAITACISVQSEM